MNAGSEEIEMLRAELERAYEALRCLSNEASAILGLSEPYLRQVVGNTNVSCLKLRIDEARQALSQRSTAMQIQAEEGEPK